MRIPSSPAEAAILSTLLFPFLATAAGNYDCSNIVLKKKPFDLSELGGPRSVLWSQDEGASYKNTTYTIDICRPLKRKKGVSKEEECPNGTRLCAIEHVINKDSGSDTLERAFPIAGELKLQGGKDMNAKWERLSDSKSHADVDKDGLRLEMNGGWIPQEDKKNRYQKAIVEFICDKSRKGDENLWDPEDKYDDGKSKRDETDEESDPVDEDPTSPSLTFRSYTTDKEDADVLRLEWRTKYACADSKDEEDEKKTQHWGFFTWFIIIAFLSTATYLIFGSWLNYNRYGARGWDLLPHGDTIRDIPYLLKDWIRRVLNTVQGGGSRGGYAAV